MQDLEQTDVVSYMGIDVSKRHLDIHIEPRRKRWRVENNPQGHLALIQHMRGFHIGLIVFEATGKYHRALHSRLHEAGFACSVINPRQARHYAKALGFEAKTDMLDAQMLAMFALQVQPGAKPSTAKLINELKELVATRRAKTTGRTACKNRLNETSLPMLRQMAKAQLAQNQRQVGKIEAAIITMIKSDPNMCKRYSILLSIPGMGKVNAFTCLAEMPELGAANAKQIAALAGLAPMARESGLLKSKRCIKGGRKPVRNALYMAALAAARCNPDMKAFYNRLITNGKPPKSALTAVMRKLIILANTLIAQNRKWIPKPP